MNFLLLPLLPPFSKKKEKMATTFIYLSGKAKWAKVYKPDEAFNTTFWRIDVDLDPKSQAVFDKSGLRLKPKTAEDGTFITFRRPTQKQFKTELKEFDPPKVVDKNGEDFSQTIGNGSEVTIKVEVYDSFKGKGHRLVGVRVDNLVEYNPPAAEAAGETTVKGLPF